MKSEVFRRVMDGIADTPQERVLAKLLASNETMFFQLWQEAWDDEQRPVEVANWPTLPEATSDDLPEWARRSATGELEYFCQGHNDWHPVSEFRRDYNPGSRGGHASCSAYYERNKVKRAKSDQAELAFVESERPERYVNTKQRRMNSIAPDGFLYCTGCEVFKPISEFHSDRSKTDRQGRHTHCRECKKKTASGN